jgi:CRP-like cAMP-binding protein
MNPKTVTSIPLFSDVPRRKRTFVASLADEIDVAAGTVLTREGSYASSFYVIVDGSAEVWSRGDKVNVLGRGGFFGELGILNRPTRTATVVARAPMRLLVVGARELKSLLHELPAVDEKVKKTAARRTATA